MSEKRFFGFWEFGTWVRSRVQTLTDYLNQELSEVDQTLQSKADQSALDSTNQAVATKLDATATAVDSAKLEGSTKAQVITDVQTALALGTASKSNIFVSTVDPVAADGKDGDLWIKYTP